MRETLSNLELKALDHSLDPGHVNPHFSANEHRARDDGTGPLLTRPSSASRHWPTGFFPALSTATSGTVLGGCSSGRPPALPVARPPQALLKTVSPLSPFSLSPPPPPAQQARLPTASPQRQSPQRPPSSPRSLRQPDRCSGPGTDRGVPSAMSAPEERDPAQGGQDRADGGADCDPRLVGVPVVPAEGSDPIVSVAAFLVSQTVTRALQEIGGGEEATQPTVEEDGDIWSAEQEEDMEAGREEEEDQDYEGEEEEDEDEPGDHAEEFEDVERHG
ncbi:proline-rich proteoglycan 2-like [Diceros bicornis minor]|uniref:proline-rich proteoglycan 2-like n=1 Tax=Diceros bicornis minor TaxID=77932 RepID=UPI0026EAEE9F|nr:proline-rich proteoglycan 2-like [Diceros bicornis minor]